MTEPESDPQARASAPGAPPSASDRRRRTGVTIPLFSLRGARSWGIGEIPDLVPFAGWARAAGLGLVQILPLGEIAGSETSPYSALSAFGIDPMYIAVEELPDLPADHVREALGGDAGVGLLEAARASARVDYGAVRELKARALRFGFERFREHEHARDTARARELRAFVEGERAWLEDFALFRALKDSHGGVSWIDWPAELRDRKAAALADARARLAEEILFHEYLQFSAHAQWARARAALRAMGVELMGDLPFMVGRDSADVWANAGEFRMDMSVGAPPDQFNPEGQDWGLPPYGWEAMTKNGFSWLRRRARYTGKLYDRFRIDHLVGFYRTFVRPPSKEPGHLAPGTFDPAEPEAQLAHGERVMRAMLEGAAEGGAALIAEDLGTVPPWVRTSLAKLGVPGYKVLIWEKDGEVFRDPATYPAVSVACFGTHDTEPVAAWWSTRSEAERAALARLPLLSARASELSAELTPAVHSALLDLIQSAPSELVLLLVQDVLGTHERINTPSTMGAHNWTYRLPGTVAQLEADPSVAEIVQRVRQSVVKSGRS